SKLQASGTQRCCPAVARSDRARLFKQPFMLFDSSKPGELRVGSVILANKEILSVQDWRIADGLKISVLHAKGLKVDREREGKGRMRISLEVRVAEIGNFWFLPVEFNHVCTVHAADIAARAALIQP